MRTKSGTIKILKADYVSGHVLQLEFSDGKVQLVDFGPFLQTSVHPDIRKFLTKRHFRRFTLKNGELMWGDFDMIFPVLDLYRNAIHHGKPELKKRAG